MTREEFLKGFSFQDKLEFADMLLGYFYDTHYPDMKERINALQQRISECPLFNGINSTEQKTNKPPVL